jgi:3-dehydroquinate synthase
METIISASVGGDKYPVVVSSKGLSSLSAYLSEYASSSVLLVVDSVFQDTRCHPDPSFTSLLNSFPCVFFDGGLESKSLRALSDLCDEMFAKSLPRDGVLVGIGGGVVGDLAGMAASIFQRGIRLVHVPTTATSMIDSSIGGKTGVNHANQVNLLGTYYNPKGVFIDTRFLHTLDLRDFSAGIAEAIKMALISDRSMCNFFLKNCVQLMSLNDDSLHRLVTWSVQTKLFHVSSDFKESSTRLLLNYGHTFGQALESFYGLYQDYLRHGEAVSLGMCCAASLADSLCTVKPLPSESLLTRHHELLSSFRLPTALTDLSLPKAPTADLLVELTANDKKRTSQSSRFILIDQIGSAGIFAEATKPQLADAFKCILC